MTRLINADELIAVFNSRSTINVVGEGLCKSIIAQIEALPSAQAEKRTEERTETHACDCISRQAAIDAIEHRLCEPAYQHTGEDWYAGMNCAECELYDLPSAQPDTVSAAHGKWVKSGRWGRVYRCDQCGNYLDFDGVNVGRGDANYCPNCGADMRG